MSPGAEVQIPGVLRALQRHGCLYRIVPTQSPEINRVVEWIELHFPILYTQFDWSKAPVHTCVGWSEIEDLVPAFEEVVSSLPSSSIVVVMWNDESCPALEMRLEDVRKVSKEIFEAFEASLDTWIVSQKEAWLIEMHHEGTLCFGKTSAATRERKISAN
jgi:hypothetical protein